MSKDISDPCVYLSLPSHYSVTDLTSLMDEVEENQLDEEEEVIKSVADDGGTAPDEEVEPHKILITENVRTRGFRADTLIRDGSGLDYEHCVVVVAHLAKMHAVSYSMRKETNMDIVTEFPVLRREDVPILTSSHSTHVR